MNEEAVYDRAKRLRAYLKRLKTEESLLIAQLPALVQIDTDDVHTHGAECSGVHAEADGRERLDELRYLVWETAVELESVLIELAEAEVERLVTVAVSTPGDDLGATCSAAGAAIISRYADSHGKLMNATNNVAHLLTHFSASLEINDPRGATDPSSDCDHVTVLRDEAQVGVYGVRVNDREVRFVDIDQGMENFRKSVIAAIEEWRTKRLVRMVRRTELRAQMQRPPSAME